MTETMIITDRNEIKALFAWGVIGKSIPRNDRLLDFEFEVTNPMLEARRAYAANQPIPVQSFIAASRYIDRLIAEYRLSQRRGKNDD